MKKKKNSIDRREEIRVVTKNDFITCIGLQDLSTKAKKLLYIAMAQVREHDKDFQEYHITPIEFADMMKIDVSHVYKASADIAKELSQKVISIEYRNDDEEEFRYRNYRLFEECEFTHDADIVFRLSPEMKDLLLELKGNFSKPLLDDFVQMKSTYSMAIWHLFQREMQSKKPMIKQPIKFYISLEELRFVTGTDTKATYDKLSNFKNKILDKALREIEEKCLVSITYTNKKEGKNVVGFDFVARSFWESP